MRDVIFIFDRGSIRDLSNQKYERLTGSERVIARKYIDKFGQVPFDKSKIFFTNLTQIYVSIINAEN